MRAFRIFTVALALSLALPAAILAADAAEPPSPSEAPVAVAGEPSHARNQPIDVIAGHVYALPTLLDGLALDDPQMRARSAFLLGQVASSDAKDALLEALEDPSREVRMFAGIALARMGHSEGLNAAHAAYYGNRWWIRYWAVDALARLDAVPEAALGDPDPLVRTIAEDARDGGWEPAGVQRTYAGPEDASLDELVLRLSNYMIGETDWWWHAGRYEQIIRGNETIVWLDPGWVEGLTNAAYLYWSLGRDVEALATYRRAVDMHPESWQSHFELGFFYFNAQKRYAEALPHFEKARELDCPQELARMHAHALEKIGRMEAAYEVWQELLAKYPDDLVVRHNLRRLEKQLEAG